jgi:hypothetical protein
MASSPRVQQILSLAADLSREECEQVTAELLSALEPGEVVGPDEWEAAWRHELARRSTDRSPGVPLPRVRQLVNEALAQAQAERDRR